ncbi:hypothetical protein AB0D10_03710 [Kitasatospora sp. NPDC048545]|uniref:hypothetical protein n=1 Tax=Kitasatospora sp. NPDC048545 TaxID=3157208 RepID=UPI0033FC4E40
MTDLAIPEPRPAAVAVQPTAAAVPGKSIADWAHEADLAYQLADRLSTTSFIPSTMRGKVGDITACLLAGNELGLPPMAALKSMDVIHGTPGLRAHAMRALLQSRGHEIELVESSDTVCRMRGRRNGSEAWQEVVWTIARAQLAGFVAKNSNYKSQPTNMLVARATGEICRLVASDALHGVPYTVEELRDSQLQITAVQAGAPVTAAEILSRRGPAPQEIAPADGTDAEATGDTDPVDGEVYDEAAKLWDDILDAADDKHGWSPEQTEREFLNGSMGVPAALAPLETLRAFHAHLTGGAS